MRDIHLSLHIQRLDGLRHDRVEQLDADQWHADMQRVSTRTPAGQQASVLHEPPQSSALPHPCPAAELPDSHALLSWPGELLLWLWQYCWAYCSSQPSLVSSARATAIIIVAPAGGAQQAVERRMLFKATLFPTSAWYTLQPLLIYIWGASWCCGLRCMCSNVLGINSCIIRARRPAPCGGARDLATDPHRGG